MNFLRASLIPLLPILALLAAPRAHALDPEVVEGVSFTGAEAEAVVYGVNHADLPTLDSFLDVRAANGLIAARPFTNVAGMGPVPFVGPSALGLLRAQAPEWTIALQNNAPPLAARSTT
jgi:hypothetical protein